MGRSNLVVSPSVRRGLGPLSFFVTFSALAAFACGDDALVEPFFPPPGGGAGAGNGPGGPAGMPNAGAAGSGPQAGGGQGGAGGSQGDAGGSQGGAGGASGGSQGGAGACTGEAAGGSAGAGEEPAATCLDASSYANLLALDAALPLCVARVHSFEVPAGYDIYGVPTWGRHGGPLVLIPGADGASLTFHRWSPPVDATGPALHSEGRAQNLTLPAGPLYWGPPLDLPFGGQTIAPFTMGSSTTVAGEVFVFDTATYALAHRHHANGFYAAFGLADGCGGGSLFFTGLSPLSTEPSDEVDSAVYAARSCATGFAGPGCEPGHKVGDWESSSGPVAVDAGGRGFFALSTFPASLQVRGFAKSALLAPAPSEGEIFVQSTNYAQSLAALAPSASAPGYLFVDEAVGAGQRLSAVAYTAGSGGEPVKGDVIADALTPAAGVSARVFGPGGGEVWALALTEGAGHFVVLRRKP